MNASTRHRSLWIALCAALAALGVLSASPATAADGHQVDWDNRIERLAQTPYRMEHCLLAALDRVDGRVAHLQVKNEPDQGFVYEFRIVDKSGQQWAVECDPEQGRIVEVEWQWLKPDDARFKKRVKITEADARKMVLELYPGTIRETVYEMESDGQPAYEFDVHFDGVELSIEVNAVTGEIDDVNHELFDIGAHLD